MSILIDAETRVLIQGMTGKEGQKAAKAMLEYGTNVVCGVTPGKGGQEVEGKPIFNSVREVIEFVQGHPNETPRLRPALRDFGGQASSPPLHSGRTTGLLENLVSAVYVPPFAAKAAIMEAVEAGIPLINIIVERIPIQDTAYCLAAAKERGARIIGPSSLGLINPGVGRIGVVGGPKELADQIFKPGSIGIISRSGGMTNEVSWQVRKAGFGQSAAVHVGGDLLMGTTYADLLELFERDDQTKAVIIFGEHGGSYEFEIVKLIEQKKYTKPLAIYIGGKFANMFPEGMNIGHAGAIVERGKGAAEKEAALKAVGVMVAERYEDLVALIKPLT